MRRPQVTVMIPVYNRADCLPRALQSVIDQTISDWEVVVVDNASTDATLDVARAFAAKEPRIRVVANEANLGIAASRNKAVQHSTGRYVTPLDSDDWMAPHRLERLLGAAQTYDAVLLCDDVRIVPEDDQGQGVTLSELCGEPISAAVEFDMAGVLSRLGFERDGITIGLTKPIFDRQFLVDHDIRYDPSLEVGEDYWFVADCVAAGANLVFIPDAMYTYFIHGGQTTKTTDPRDDIASGRRRLDAYLHSELGRADHAAQHIGRQQLQRLDTLIAYAGFSDALKRRRFAEAGSQLVRNPGALAEFAYRLPNAMRRRYRARSGDQHAYDQLLGAHLQSRRRRSAPPAPAQKAPRQSALGSPAVATSASTEATRTNANDSSSPEFRIVTTARAADRSATREEP